MTTGALRLCVSIPPVLAIVRFGPRSWRAWLIGIVIELASRILARRATAPAASPLTEVRISLMRLESDVGGNEKGGVEGKLIGPGCIRTHIRRTRRRTSAAIGFSPTMRCGRRSSKSGPSTIAVHGRDHHARASRLTLVGHRNGRPLLTEVSETLQRVPLISLAAGTDPGTCGKKFRTGRGGLTP